MKARKILALVLSLAMMTTAFVGCSDNGSGQSTDGDTSQDAGSTDGNTEDTTNLNVGDGTMDEVQELNLVLTELRLLDVNDARNTNEIQVLSHVQEGLFRVFSDENGNDVIEPAGAESYTVSEDGLVYTFTLRDHVWSDGVPVTAQNYVDSFIRLLTAENAFSYAYMAFDIKNAAAFYEGEATAEEVGVKALDEKTFEITLETALPYFETKLTHLCFFPVRQDVIDAAGDSYLNDYTKHVFNGPFVIESRNMESEMVLAKNDSYWDAENVHLEKITLTVVPEQATQSLLLDSKELDATIATTDYYARWKAKADDGELIHIAKVGANTQYMAYNQHTGGPSGLMNNEKIRLAMSLAVDRVEYNELIYSGLNTPAYGLIPDGMLVGTDEFRLMNPDVLSPLVAEYANDAEKLQTLFKEGLAEVDPSLTVEDVNLILHTANDTSETKASSEYFQQSWQSKLGINITLNLHADYPSYVEARANNEYDLVLMGWYADYNDPMTFFELFNTTSGYAQYMGGYSNADYDTWFDTLAAESDEAVRSETYVDLENNLVVEHAGIAPIYHASFQYFTQPYVYDLSTPTFGPQFEFSRVYISGK